MSPSLSMRAYDPCPSCGYGVEWFQVGSYRINKGSLRLTSPILGAAAHVQCPECGFTVRRDDFPYRWQLEPDSALQVAEVRARRWGG